MKIKANGPIISSNVHRYYTQENVEAISPAYIEKELNRAGGKDVEIYLNSNGGSVFAGSEIYTLLKEYTGKVTVKITGLAASAASFLVCAADKALISPLGQLMIHNAATSTYGNADNHRSNYNMLTGTDKAIANVYRMKTKLTVDKLLELMNQTTWMNADKAKELGFVDGVLFDSKNVEPITQASYEQKKLSKESQDVVDQLEAKTLNNYVMAYSSIPLNEHLQAAPKATPKAIQSTTIRSDYFVNLADLKNKQPDLYDQAIKAGMEAERKRVNDLRALQNAGASRDVIENAISKGIDAGTLAIEIVQNQKHLVSDQEASNLLMEAAQRLSNDGTEVNNSEDSDAINLLVTAAQKL